MSRFFEETYPGSGDVKSVAPVKQHPCPGRDYNPSKAFEVGGPIPQGPSEYAGGLGDVGGSSPLTPYGEDTRRRQALAESLAADTADGSYSGEGSAPRSSSREFLYADSRDHNKAPSKRKTFGFLITANDANYQAFLDLVAFHMIDDPEAFGKQMATTMVNVLTETLQ